MTESLRQLRHVLALCEHRNFRRAADAVSITQSALSVSIRRLEEDYGVALFERGRDGVRATEFGEILARMARQTVAAMDQTRREVALLSSLESGQVVIGSDPWMADDIVAPALARLLQKYPKLRFRLRTHGWDELQEDLVAKNVDVYVGSPFEKPDANLKIRNFTLSSPVIICRRDHPLTQLPALFIKDVLPFPLLVPKLPGWYLHWLGEQYASSRSSEELHDLFLRADDLTVIRRIVRETDAVTASLVNSFPVDLSPQDFAMLPIEDLSHIASPGIIATLSDRPVPAAAQGFIDEVELEIQQLNARLP
ncbi:MAG: LysR family transcriptional regulator [Congregibacter sp.]|nr:LysR family transcriptional regulator [Congregibacter sp.]